MGLSSYTTWVYDLIPLLSPSHTTLKTRSAQTGSLLKGEFIWRESCLTRLLMEMMMTAFQEDAEVWEPLSSSSSWTGYFLGRQVPLAEVQIETWDGFSG